MEQVITAKLQKKANPQQTSWSFAELQGLTRFCNFPKDSQGNVLLVALSLVAFLLAHWGDVSFETKELPD